jgi:hypothetical protein
MPAVAVKTGIRGLMCFVDLGAIYSESPIAIARKHNIQTIIKQTERRIKSIFCKSNEISKTPDKWIKMTLSIPERKHLQLSH